MKTNPPESVSNLYKCVCVCRGPYHGKKDQDPGACTRILHKHVKKCRYVNKTKYVCMDAWMYVYMYSMDLCMHAGMYACMHVCIYVWMHACMHACMHVVCM